MVKVSYRSIRQWQRQGSKVFSTRMSAVLSFEKVMEILSKSFSTLDKDRDESQYANDFSGACNYFSAQVSRLHGGAQLENSKYTKSVMCLPCMVVEVKTAAAVEDVVALVVVVGLVAVVEVALVGKR